MEATRENVYKAMVFNSVLNALQPVLEQQYQYARFSKYTPYNPNRKRYFNLHPKKYGRGHLRNTAIKKEEKFRHKNQSLYKKFINKIYPGIYRDLRKIKNVYINIADGTGEVKFQGFREKSKGR